MMSTLRQSPHTLNPFLHDGGGLYTTTTLVESLFTLIIQSNSSNCVISLVVTIFLNEMSFLSISATPPPLLPLSTCRISDDDCGDDG